MISVTRSNADRFQHWLNLVIGALLFIAPWVLGYAGVTGAAWTAWLTGIIIAVVAVIALVQRAQWEDWVELVLGVWVVASPWIIGFAGVADAMWAHVVLGFVLAVIGAWSAWSDNRPSANSAAA